MAEAPSPPSMGIDFVVDLHTNSAAASAAAHALLNNENSSNASSDAALNIKFPILYTSSSDTETDDFHIQRNRLPIGGGSGRSGSAAVAGSTTTTTGGVEVVRSTSPPPNCAICLGRCKNKCFTDSCVHQFCFKCLCEWSKVKAECPLCKQAFRSIIHNVKAIDQYEEYLVQQPVVQIPPSPLEVTYQGALNGDFILNSNRRYYNFHMRSWPAHSAGVVSSRGGPFTVRNHVPNDGLTGNSIPSASVAVNAAVESLPMRRYELLNLYRAELPDEISSTLSLGQLWRRYIYDRKLYALPVCDISGRYRESSARFYRNNPGQRVRLIPFANRDIICLLRNTNHDVSTVLESLNEGLEVSNILSRSFRRRLQPYLGERTAHFIHELSNFARSPYDMIGYDRTVRYAPQAADGEDVIEFSTSSDEETNNNSGTHENPSSTNSSNNNTHTHVNESAASQRTARRNAQASSTTSRTRSAGTSEFRVQSRSSTSAQTGMHSPMSLLSFTITTTSEGSETPGLSVAVSAGSGRGHAQVAAINLSTHNRAHNENDADLVDTVEITGSSSGGGGGAARRSRSRINAVDAMDMDGTLEIVDSSSGEAGSSANTNSNNANANSNVNNGGGAAAVASAQHRSRIILDDTLEIIDFDSGEDASASTVNTNTNNANANANANTGNNEVALPSAASASASNLIPEGSPQIIASIALTTSSSDECEFVLERKPPHLRTPEMVSLNSESDSDVVFVDETKAILAEATYSTSENEAITRMIFEAHDLLQQSTSTGLRPRTVRQLVASKRQSSTSNQQQGSSNPSKKRRMRTRHMKTPPECSSSSSDASTSDDDFKKDDSEYNTRRGGRRRRRSTVRKRPGTRTNKAKSSRKRNQKKSQQTTVNPKKETPQALENTENDRVDNEPKAKRRRVAKKPDSSESHNEQNYSNINAKHTSSSDEEESSTEEDDKVNLKALQLRLKKSLSDAEDNVKNDDDNDDDDDHTYNNSPVYTSNTNFDEMSRESNLDTANSLNYFNVNDNLNHNNNTNNNNNNSNFNDTNDDDDDPDSHSMPDDGPSCSNVAMLEQQSGSIFVQKLVGRTTPPTSPQQPTTSAAAAAVAASAATVTATAEAEAEAAAALASISTFNEHERRVSFDESNASFVTSCVASNSETPQDQQEEETRANYRLDSMSPAALSPGGSVEPYVPQRIRKPLPMPSDIYGRNSPSSLDSVSSMDSYQLPSTSQQQKRVHSYSPAKDMVDSTTNTHLNDSDSSNSSTTSSSSQSSSAWSDSEAEERDSDEHPLA